MSFCAGELVAMTGADRDAMAALGAATRKHGGSALGLHSHTEAMRLGTVAAVRLKCALRHKNPWKLEVFCPCGSAEKGSVDKD
jgi:hypothetical protein